MSLSADRVPEVSFRLMRLEDIPAVHGIEVEAFPTPWSEQAFVNELTQNHFAHYVVMEYGDRVIGYGGMWVIIDEAHVTNVAVLPEFRGRKLGSRLMAELGDRAWRLGAKHMTLEVRESNMVAQSLYMKYGFKPSGVRPGYYSDNGEDAIIMWAELPLRG